RGVGPVGDRGLRARPGPLARNYISHNYLSDVRWCEGSPGNRPPAGEAGRAHAGPEGAETEEGAEKDCWPRPSVPTLRRPAFPARRDSVPPSRPPRGVSSGSRFPCQPRGVERGEEKRRLGEPPTPPASLPARDRPGRDGRQHLAALPGAPPGRSAPSAAAGDGQLHALLGQRLHVHPSGRPEGVLLPAHAPEGLAGDRVLDGAGLDIDFHLASPEGRTLVFEQRKSDGVHTVETEDGDYMFCFDNTFSTISEKVIFFELILDNMGEQEQEQEDWKKYITGTDMLDMKLEDILESINSIKARLSKSGHIQTLLRAFEARDRNIQESNFDRVNFWSMVNLVVMVVVSAIQVYMLKSLFEDKRKSRT
uniref:Transmembrane p24 trafficking protein 5 n=2 Tax=Canis lupus familiaris TaxID=9615 RepID=A0A8I3NUM2_CANLF